MQINLRLREGLGSSDTHDIHVKRWLRALLNYRTNTHTDRFPDRFFTGPGDGKSVIKCRTHPADFNVGQNRPLLRRHSMDIAAKLYGACYHAPHRIKRLGLTYGH